MVTSAVRTKWLAASLMLVAGFGAGPLFAATGAVTVSPVVISAPLQAALHKQYGDAEAAVLQSAVKDRLERSLNSDAASNSGASPKRIEVTIDDAKPSHPTRYQIQENPQPRSAAFQVPGWSTVARGAAGRRWESTRPSCLQGLCDEFPGSFAFRRRLGRCTRDDRTLQRPGREILAPTRRQLDLVESKRRSRAESGREP